tara:strand:- start:10760 stop:11062 length:303 start_codon:yes stop_codon:yes gene_type:complete
MVYYVDIDETICYYKGVREYPNAIPNLERIEKMNKLFKEGNTVVYWTARGGTTGIDWTELTTKQLSEWGVKYDELRMWKPSYDLFICDKAVNSERFFDDK